MLGSQNRISYLDGLRGFAAVQVVFLHYVSAFAPAIGNLDPDLAHPIWENYFIKSPLFFPADGYLAVAIFFLISGTVLTYSFESSLQSIASQVARRLARLGLPMAASVLLGAFWFLLFRHTNVTAAAVLGGNAWLRDIGPPHVSLSSIFREIVLCGLLLGHAHFSLILPGGLGPRLGLPNLLVSYNQPLWTLHLEFFGSLIVLALVTLERRLPPGPYRIICAMALLGLIAHPLGLFVIGYLAAKWLKTEMWESISSRWVVKGIGVAAIVLGIIMSGHSAPAWLLRTYNHLTVFEELPMRADDFHFFSQYGAILIFFGVLVLPAVQQVLAGRVGLALGRFSFSLYLVHFPILMTLTAWLIVWFQPLGRGPDIVFSSFCGLGVTTVTAILFERLVDRPATELSRRIRLFAPDKSRRPGFGRQTSPSEYRDAD